MGFDSDTAVWVASMSVPLLGGVMGSVVSSDAVDNWYPNLKRPWFTPPRYLFGPIWTLLYLGMGKAFYIVYKNSDWNSSFAGITIALYAAQLLLNWLWSPLFFNIKRLDLALADMGMMVCLILACIFTFNVYSSTAAKLMVPYLLFATVALSINWFILVKNDPEVLRGKKTQKKVE